MKYNFNRHGIKSQNKQALQKKKKKKKKRQELVYMQRNGGYITNTSLRTRD
jgi:hypothetical protein